MHARHSKPVLDLEAALNHADHLNEAVWFMVGYLTKTQESPLTDAISDALHDLSECLAKTRNAYDELTKMEEAYGEFKAVA